MVARAWTCFRREPVARHLRSRGRRLRNGREPEPPAAMRAVGPPSRCTSRRTRSADRSPGRGRKAQGAARVPEGGSRWPRPPGAEATPMPDQGGAQGLGSRGRNSTTRSRPAGGRGGGRAGPLTENPGGTPDEIGSTLRKREKGELHCVALIRQLGKADPGFGGQRGRDYGRRDGQPRGPR